MSGRTLLWIRVGLVLLTVAVYVRVPGFEFTALDDGGYVTERPQVLEGPTASGLAWAFSSTAQSNWHPLTWISLMLDARLGGGQPWSFHLTSVLLHIANTLLLFQLLLRLTSTRWKSAFAAAVFGLHPLHVESVAWVAERKDVLSTCFGLLAMLAYVRYVKRPGSARYGVVLALFALSLLSKPMLVTLPLLLLLLDFWPLGRFDPGTRSWRKPFLEKLPLLGLSALSSVATIYAQASGGAIASLETRSLYARTANALVAYVAYLGDSVWPTGLAVPYPFTPETLTSTRVAASAVFLVALTVVALALHRRAGYVAVGWFWFLGALLPVIGLVQVGSQARADRYMYVPLIGLSLVVVWGIPDLLNRAVRSPATWGRRLTAVAGCLAVVTLATAGHLQTRYWRDGVTLFRRALAVTTHNAVAHNGLGVELVRQERAAESLEHFRKALEIAPEHLGTHVNMAAALVTTGAIDEAIGHYREALRISPNYVAGYVSFGGALLRQDRPEEAAVQFREALRREPDHAAALGQLAVILEQSGNIDEALALLRRATAADVRDSGARLALGLILLGRGEIDEAATQLNVAVELDPDNAKTRRSLGVALARQGRYTEAIEHFTEALRLDPDHDGTRRNLERAKELLSGNR
jgi:tetratricopeptide (TPR) repeat protein